MLSLKIFEDAFRELDMLRSPMRLWKNYPIQLTFGALIERRRQKRLGVPHKSDLGGR